MNKLMVNKVIKLLSKTYSSSFFTKRKTNPFYVLISTVLSQRTRDDVTYPAANKLFKKFKTPKHFVKANTKEIEKLIKGVGFYKVKAGRIKQISEILLKKYRGRVPNTEEELLKLLGVGRKTANCVLV